MTHPLDTLAQLSSARRYFRSARQICKDADLNPTDAAALEKAARTYDDLLAVAQARCRRELTGEK